jgi:hypothetical protein
VDLCDGVPGECETSGSDRRPNGLMGKSLGQLPLWPMDDDDRGSRRHGDNRGDRCYDGRGRGSRACGGETGGLKIRSKIGRFCKNRINRWDRFHPFLKNRLVNFLKNKEYFLKKLEFIPSFFVKTELKKIKAVRYVKSIEVKTIRFSRNPSSFLKISISFLWHC